MLPEKRLKFPMSLKMTTNYELNQKQKKKIVDLLVISYYTNGKTKTLMFEVSGTMSKVV